MSLQIRMNGQILDLTPDSRADLERTSPYLVYDDILSGKATIPNLPATARNRRALGFPDLLQSETGHYRFFCEKYWNGQLIEQGTALLTEAGEDYSFTVIQPLGEIFGDWQAKKLSELDLGTAAAHPSGYVPVIAQNGANWAAFPPVVNPDFYGQDGAGIGYAGLMNNPAAGTVGPVVPMPFLSAILQRIGELTGVTFDGTFMADAALQSLLLFNTREVMPDETVIHLNRHVPDMKLSEFILELRNLLNLAITVKPFDGRITLDFTDDYITRPCRIDWSTKAVKEYRKRPETLPRLLLGSEWDGGDALVKDKPAQTLDYLTPTAGLDSDDVSKAAVIRSKFSTCLSDPTTGYLSIKQTGVSERFNQLTAKFAPRLVFFNGLVNGVAQAGNTHAASGQTLFWNGPGGLQATRWAGVEAMRSRQFYVVREMNLTETDVATLDFREKVYINGVNYLLVNVLVSLPVTAPALCTFVRC